MFHRILKPKWSFICLNRFNCSSVNFRGSYEILIRKRTQLSMISIGLVAFATGMIAKNQDSRCDEKVSSQNHSIFLDEHEQPNSEVDFIVIGYGNAGSAASQHLEAKCPKAKIMCVDPHIQATFVEGLVVMKHGSAIRLNHSKKTIDILSSSGQLERIRFKHSILISTGVRGAPPPMECIDERISERVLELRSTQLVAFNRLFKEGKISHDNHLYPVLPKHSVRQIATMAASQGARVCILGSDLEAVEIAATASLFQQKINGKKSTNDGLCLVCGGAAPLDHLLPRYLSGSVSKRLRAHGIQCEKRCLVKYISSISNTTSTTNEEGVEIYLSKSFDSLETKRFNADLVIIAPRVVGQSGCASIPTLSNTLRKSHTTFRPWSKLTSVDEHVISCYSDDGRVSVNSELSAASNIYAAGSVAKYPNHTSGHATVAGEGVVEASAAGIIAADNMTKDYFARLNVDVKDEAHRTNIYFKTKSLPVLRTDRLWITSDEHSALSNIGIHALFVGNCDSETMSTHGFWWTNLSRRLTRSHSNDSKRQKAVYGSGIVYYLDRAGTIRGIMLWGLPFASERGFLNQILVERLKNTIHSNGDDLIKEHKDLIATKNLDSSLLHTDHLSEESKALVSIALGTSKDKISRPIYRFTAAKPVHITSLGILRKSPMIGNGGVAEDIFERSTHHLGHFEGERMRHPSLVHYFDPSWYENRSKSVETLDKIDSDERMSKNPDYAARPPKEETIWFRKAETSKTFSVNEAAAEQFLLNMKQGVFSDGSQAVEQASKILLTSKKQEYKTRTQNENNEEHK